MAVSITSVPPLNTGLDDIILKLNVNDGGGGNIIKQGVVQLVIGISQNVASEEISYPYAETDWNVSFLQQLEGMLKTTIPTLNNTAIEKDETFSEVYSLVFWERTINIDTGEKNDTEKRIASLIAVFNSRRPYYLPIDYTAQFTVFTDRPEKNVIYDNQNDWFWISSNRDGGVDISFRGVTIQEGIVEKNITIPSFQTSILPIGTANGFWIDSIPTNEQLAYYTITISKANKTQSFRFDILSDCGEEDYLDVIFQESMGGFTSLRFQNGKNLSSARRSDNFICNPNIVKTNEQERLIYGKQSVNSFSTKIIALSKSMKFELNHERFLDSFTATNNAFVKKKINGVWQLLKVTLNNSRYQIFAKNRIVELNAQLELSQTSQGSI